MLKRYINDNKFHVFQVLLTLLTVLLIAQDRLEYSLTFMIGYIAAFYIEIIKCREINGRLAPSVIGLLLEMILVVIFLFNIIS